MSYGGYIAGMVYRMQQMERLQRAFEAQKVAALEARRARREALGDDSSIRWGGPSSFQERENTGVTISVTSTPEYPTDETRDRPKRRYSEISRQTAKVKVYNPEDDEMWIEVERILRVTFSGSDGYDHEFILNWSDT